MRGLFLFGAGLLVGYFVARRREGPKPDPRRADRPIVDAAYPSDTATKPPASSGPEPEPEPPPKAEAPKVADGRCAYVTRRGTRCTRKVLSGTDRCWQHSQ
jgi:hypothetical protein